MLIADTQQIIDKQKYHNSRDIESNTYQRRLVQTCILQVQWLLTRP